MPDRNRKLDDMLVTQIKDGNQQAIGIGIIHILDEIYAVRKQTTETNGRVKKNRMAIVMLTSFLSGLGILKLSGFLSFLG